VFTALPPTSPTSYNQRIMERTFAIIKPDAVERRVVLLALEAPDAIKKWRNLMGATDPAKADAGTLRKDFGSNIERNATHGSDAPETAAFELGSFFRGMELL
jgi:nucleoside diphosphate kinase